MSSRDRCASCGIELPAAVAGFPRGRAHGGAAGGREHITSVDIPPTLRQVGTFDVGNNPVRRFRIGHRMVCSFMGIGSAVPIEDFDIPWREMPEEFTFWLFPDPGVDREAIVAGREVRLRWLLPSVRDEYSLWRMWTWD